MNCPKCGANNDDAAVCCSLCYDMFKAKPKAPYPQSRLEKIAFPEVSCGFDGWRAAGPLVIGLNGLHFFIQTLERVKASTGEAVGGGIGGVGGFLIGAAIDSAIGEPPLRPEKVDIRRSAEILDQCAPVLAEAPGISKCKEYFRVDKKDIKSLAFGFWGGLTVKASWIELAVSGIAPEEKASAFFKTKGYPYEG